MKNLSEIANRYQVIESNMDGGAFYIPSPIDAQNMLVVASFGLGWDHVSVSRPRRIPNQIEMDYIYRLFFNDDETAVQFFVPSNEHINLHPYCLHLWRHQSIPFPKPNKWLV
jgi:hypothetical protein